MEEDMIRASIERDIRSAKERDDWLGLGFVLQYVEELKGQLKKFESFSKSPVYKKRVVNAIKRFKEEIKRVNEKLRKYGSKAFADPSEADLHERNKELLKLLEKEEKRLRLKI